MADDRHYVAGDWFRIDDRSGFKVRARRTRKEWNGLIVKDSLFEARQPQDFVRGVRDDQSVPDPRPPQTDVFLGVETILTASAAAQSATLNVASINGFLSGDRVSVILDDGTVFFTFLQTAAPGTGNFSADFDQSFSALLAPGQLQLTAPLPRSSPTGSYVVDLKQTPIAL